MADREPSFTHLAPVVQTCLALGVVGDCCGPWRAVAGLVLPGTRRTLVVVNLPFARSLPAPTLLDWEADEEAIVETLATLSALTAKIAP